MNDRNNVLLKPRESATMLKLDDDWFGPPETPSQPE